MRFSKSVHRIGDGFLGTSSERRTLVAVMFSAHPSFLANPDRQIVVDILELNAVLGTPLDRRRVVGAMAPLSRRGSCVRSVRGGPSGPTGHPVQAQSRNGRRSFVSLSTESTDTPAWRVVKDTKDHAGVGS
jgi:hypothetical protein